MVSTQIRHKMKTSGENASWATVTMATPEAARRAAADLKLAGKGLRVSMFDEKRAEASSGAMAMARTANRPDAMAAASCVQNVRKRRPPAVCAGPCSSV
jgi:hypothetical protein